VKRKELVARLEQAGFRLIRHGGLHDIYKNPANGRIHPVPRHNEINEILARKILQTLTDKDKEE
jgi:predicted RNA binding protein YcfA (HicA-like mRNA interferase family)